jgi:ligand-binding sensor domain-containing protein
VLQPLPPEQRRDIVPRALDLVPRLSRQLARAGVKREVYVVAGAGDPTWASYAATRRLRCADLDPVRGWIWLATWGGVLCWLRDAGLCVHHTSAHGLLGNSTRNVVVDDAGHVWAGGQGGGLCSLTPMRHDAGPKWQSHADLSPWTVLRLAARRAPGGGVIAALRDGAGESALGEIVAPDAPLRLIAQGGLATRTVDALWVDDDATWIGNAWGLHRQPKAGRMESLALEGKQIRALARDARGVLWVGTLQGLYRLEAGAATPLAREDAWPGDEVIDLASEPETGTLWVATTREIGRIVDDEWHPIDARPPEGLSALITAPGSPERAWAASANGLYELSPDWCEQAFTPPYDGVSNAVQCLETSDSDLWVGAVQGLHHFDGERWYADGQAIAGGAAGEWAKNRDIQAMASGHDGCVWIGDWQGEVGRVDQNVYVPGPSLTGPVVSLAVDATGTLWAATADAIYRLSSTGDAWEPVVPPEPHHIGGRIIQAICHQMAAGGEAETVSTLWVGTSTGLFRCRPDLEVWDSARQWAPEVADTVEQDSIEALVVDPHDNRLLVGTRDGLYSERPWRRCSTSSVQALAFGLRPDKTLWVGTTTGLERWSVPGRDHALGNSLERFTTASAGLASDSVTALAVRPIAGTREIWIGSLAGLSCYRY